MIYDSLGRVDQRISYDASVATTTWFDDVNDVVKLSTADFELLKPVANLAKDRSVNYTYDGSGRLIAENDGVLETRYTYDGAGRLTLTESRAALCRQPEPP